MHETGHRSPARLLAPLALIVVALAVAFVVVELRRRAAATRAATTRARAAAPPPDAHHHDRRQAAAAPLHLHREDRATRSAGSRRRPGSTVERLQELNPELDPQALLSGQKINLRE